MNETYISLACTCGATFEMTSTTFENAALHLMHRFVNAHVACGYMLPSENVDYSVKMELGEMDTVSSDTDGDEDATVA